MGDNRISMEATMTQLRDLATKRGERLWFAPDVIKVDQDYNLRDLSTPEALESLDILAASLKESGMRVPLLVRLEGEECVLVQGHRRLRAIQMLIARGIPWELVECLAEEKKRGPEDRTLDLFLSNDGEPLTELEKAEGVRRLISYGWEQGKIASKLGRSPSYVSHLLAVEGMPEVAKEMVRQGEVAASTALRTIRANGEDAGTQVLREARAEAEADLVRTKPQGSVPEAGIVPEGHAPAPKARKVTQKRIAAVQEKRDPKPKHCAPPPSRQRCCARAATWQRRAWCSCARR